MTTQAEQNSVPAPSPPPPRTFVLWMRRHWIEVAALLISIISIIGTAWTTYISQEALNVARETDRRAKLSDTAASGAAATLLAGRAAGVAAMARFAETARAAVSLGLTDKPEQLSAALHEFSSAHLPELSPSTEEFEIIARTGDDSAQALASCAVMREQAEAGIKVFDGIKDGPLPTFQRLVFQTLGADLTRAFKACSSAADLLYLHAAPEPTGKDDSDKPVVLQAYRGKPGR